MIRVRGLTVVDTDPRVTSWRFALAHVPAAEVLERKLVSWEGSTLGFEGPTPLDTRRGRGRRRGPLVEGPSARHAIHTDHGVERFDGLLFAASMTAFADFLVERYAVEPGTEVHGWLAGRPATRRNLLQLAEQLSEDRFCQRRGMSTASVPPPVGGVYYHRDVEDLALERERRSDGWWLLRTTSTNVTHLALDEAVNVGGHAIPTRVFVVASETDERLAWWDGERHGVAPTWASVPAGLRRRLERGAFAHAWRGDARPLADLAPRFVVRVPAAEEVDADAEIAAAPVESPALMLTSLSPLPLRGNGALRVVADPTQALAVLARMPGGVVYDPGARPLRSADVDLQGHAGGWLVGALPQAAP